MHVYMYVCMCDRLLYVLKYVWLNVSNKSLNCVLLKRVDTCVSNYQVNSNNVL